MDSPWSLTFDSANNVYAANLTTNTIAKFTPQGVGSVFASNGLNGTWGLAFDGAITPAMKQVVIKPRSARIGFGSKSRHG